MSIALLVAVAIAEAVIWLWRLRAGVGTSPAHAALSTVGVCATRVLWLWAGVGAVLEGRWIPAGLAYCGSAGAATYIAHAWAHRRRSA